MTKREDVNVDYNSADKASKAAENVMNHMQDVKEGMSDNAKKVAEDTPPHPKSLLIRKGSLHGEQQKSRRNRKQKKIKKSLQLT